MIAHRKPVRMLNYSYSHSKRISTMKNRKIWLTICLLTPWSWLNWVFTWLSQLIVWRGNVMNVLEKGWLPKFVRKSGIFTVLSMGKSPKSWSQNTGWSNWRGSSNSPCRFGWRKQNENAQVQHYCQVSELTYIKKNLKEDKVILSVDFSKNYENKQPHEIQCAYLGHENFTIFTAACYFHTSISIENSVMDEESNFMKLPVVIISNETKHDCNMAFSVTTSS